MLNFDLDLVALTETWLNSSVHDNEICSDMQIFRRDRSVELTGKKQGGGVLLAVKNNYVAEVFDIFDRDIEAICVKLKLNQFKCLYVVVVYFVPGARPESYRTFYNCIETKLLDQECIIVGDFNLRDYVFNNNSECVCDFKSFLNFNNYAQVNSIRNVNNVLLDLVIVSSSIRCCGVDTGKDPLLPVDQHHPALTVCLNCESQQYECEQIGNTKFNFKKANWDLMCELLRLQDWQALYECEDVDGSVDAFYGIVNNIFVQSVPRSTQVGKVFPVWFNGNIIRLVKTKERYFRRYKKYKTSYWYGKYSETRKIIKVKIKQAHNEYLNQVSDSLYNNPKFFWTYVKTQKSCQSMPMSLYYEGQSFVGSKSIADGFAMFFGSVFSPSEQLLLTTGPQNVPKDYFCSNPVTAEEVALAIKKLKGNRAIGPDGLPGYIIKGCIEFFRGPLLDIFNKSLKYSTYPGFWKCSKVIPVFKNGTRHEINNYRPISIVCSVSKVFEIVIFNRIYGEVKGIISLQQHGFLPQRSTLTNLTSFVQLIHKHLNNKAQVDVIYTDLEKAFDKIKHSVILESLESMNVTDNLTKLIKTYLCNRVQFVEVKGARSRPYNSTSGVPQGSNLGPLLFVISINGISRVVKHANLSLFADDLKLCLEILNKNDCELLQSDLNNVSEWCDKNGFKMNVKKCVMMNFTLNRNIIEYDYVIGDHVLSKTDEHKDLGICMDPSLNFIQHMTDTINDAHKVMGFIVRSTQHFNVDVCLKLFDSLVLPKLEYGSIIWSPQYEVWIKSVERIQRKFLKYMFYKKFGYYPPQGYNHQHLLSIFNRLSLENRRVKACLVYLFKLIKNCINSPDILAQLPFSINQRNNRNKNVFYLNFPRTNLYKNSPLYRMCSLFNKYANEIDIDTTSLRQFISVIDNKIVETQARV